METKWVEDVDNQNNNLHSIIHVGDNDTNDDVVNDNVAMSNNFNDSNVDG